MLFLLAGLGFAQDRGTISGAISDATGASVPGTVVTTRNVSTGLTQASRTGADGIYNLLYLPAGAYTVTAEKAGFRKAEATGVVVNVNTVVRLDMQLAVGAVEQVVEVTAASPLLETQGSNLGKVMPAKALQDLPLALAGGLRSTRAFVILTPGVIGDTNNPRIGGGLLSGQNEFLDGVTTANEQRFNQPLMGVSIEGLQEFKVQSGAYSAEFGRTSNGIVNFVTKSGTNELHGSAFMLWRNEFFDARGYTFTPSEKPVRRQTNPGGSVGGPIYIPNVYDGRNKAFFFFAYERSNYQTGRPTNLITVPIREFRTGDMRRYVDASGRMIPLYDPIDANGRIITDAFARPRMQCNGVLNMICPERIDPIAKLNLALLPDPDDPAKVYNNTRSWGGGTDIQSVPSLKSDYVISSKSRVNGFISRYLSPAIRPIATIQGLTPINNTNYIAMRNFRVSHDYVFTPNLLNHFAIGFNWRRNAQNPGDILDVPKAYRDAVQIPGVIKTNENPTQYNAEWVTFGNRVRVDSVSKTYSLNEQVAWIRGRHSVKFGFEYLTAGFDKTDCNNCNGLVQFAAAATGNPGVSGQTGSGWAAFLLGLSSGGQFLYPSSIHFVWPYYAWHIQDDWKVTSKLTLNIGLRYELPITKHEASYQNSNFNPAIPNPGAGGLPGAIEFAGTGPGRGGKARFGETRKNALGPRLGLAYQIKPKTVLRAGGSIFYQATREDGAGDQGIDGFGGQFTAPSNYLATGISFRQRDGFLPFADLVATSKPPTIDPAVMLWGTPFYRFPKSGRAPYFTDWQFTVEHSVTANSVARVSWHANLGHKLLAKKTQLNQLHPDYWAVYGTNLGRRLDDARVIAMGYKPPYDSYPRNRQLQQALRPYPQYAEINIHQGGMNDGHMTFHALEASLEHRFSSGLFLLASYTLAKVIGNADNENANQGDGYGQNTYNGTLEKTVGEQDTPHNLRFSYVYELPFGRGKPWLSRLHPAANAILGNWRVSGIHTYVSGRAMSIGSGQNLFGAGNPRASFTYPHQPLVNPEWRDDPAVAWSVPYLNKAAFRRPADMEYGDTPRRLPYLRGPGTVNEDIALLKDFPIGGERRRLEIRASAFNALNRHQLPGPDTNVDGPAFGMVVNAQGNSPRQVQVGLKLYF